MDTDLQDGKRRVVGTKQLLKQLAAGRVETIYLARDAQAHIRDRLLSLAQEKNISVVEVETMKRLGQMCGIAVGSAAAGLLNEAN